MRPIQSKSILPTFVGLLLLVPALGADEPPEAPPLHEKWRRAYRSIAESLVVQSGETRFTLHDRDLLYYTNPVRTQDQHGAVFLWTDAGRPALLASVWSAINRQDAGSRNVTYEWHSLVESSTIQVSRNGQVLWTPGEPGLAWLKLSDLPDPAKTAAARLVQMRGIARRFTARITPEEINELRLMPQPLYRYPESTPDVTDGALFVFSLATNPDLLLVLDLPKDGSWQFGLAGMTAEGLTVQLDDTIVWESLHSQSKDHVFDNWIYFIPSK